MTRPIPGLWAISCFFIQSKRRGEGLSHDLLKAAVAHAMHNGARIVEACPIARAKHSKSPLACSSVRSQIFERPGFKVVAERKPGRPLMRKVLR
jgi:predicted GNAT family acetyltransferase